MEDSDLLAILVQYLYKEKDNLKKDIEILTKKQAEFTVKEQNIGKEISIKEDYIASITELSIQNYMIFWKSLRHHDRRPCPFCYVLHHDTQSVLQALPGDDMGDVVKCEVCKRKIVLPHNF